MARSLIEVGQPALAERYARFAVDMVPNSFAARILTATALRQQGKNFESEIQFRRALDVADTDAERQMARQSMRIVVNTKKWSGNLTLGIAPTTNVGKVSSAKRLGTVFDDFLQNFTREEKPETATGVLYGATIMRHFRGPANANLNLSLGQVRREYKATENNSTTTTFRFSSQTPATASGQSYLSYERVLTDFTNSPYSQRTSVTFGHVFRSFGDRRANGSIGIDQTKYVRTGTEAQKYRASLSHDLYASRLFSVSMTVSGSTSKSDAIDYTSDRVEVGARVSLSPPSTGWRFDLSVERDWEEWREKKDVFLKRRKDLDLTTTLSVQNQNISFLGLTPALSITQQTRDSTVNLYDLESQDFFIGVSNAF